MPVACAGRDLLVNASGYAGDLLVELLDGAGDVIPGFDRSRSHLDALDALRRRVVWQEKGVG